MILEIPKELIYLKVDPYVTKVLLYIYANNTSEGFIFVLQEAMDYLNISPAKIRLCLKELLGLSVINCISKNKPEMYYINDVKEWKI